VVAVFYGTIFENLFGSPKAKILSQQLENLKLQYSLIGMQLGNSIVSLNSYRMSDDRRYRPILDMDSIPESFRKAGFGGVDRFNDLTGYMNSDLLISCWTKIEEIKNMANVQKESFKSIAERSAEWKIFILSLVPQECIMVRIFQFHTEQMYMPPAMEKLLNQDGTPEDSVTI
jgi:hypothetical protein